MKKEFNTILKKIETRIKCLERWKGKSFNPMWSEEELDKRIADAQQELKEIRLSRIKEKLKE